METTIMFIFWKEKIKSCLWTISYTQGIIQKKLLGHIASIAFVTPMAHKGPANSKLTSHQICIHQDNIKKKREKIKLQNYFSPRYTDT